MQNYFQLKARTTDGGWYEFNVCNIPVHIDEDRLVLLDIPNSPIIDSSIILRGDSESGLYEGDVILYEGERWLVCYERGFYIINENYTMAYLYTLQKPFTVLGVAGFEVEFPIPYKKRKRHLFKYARNIFYTTQIVTKEDNCMIIRTKRARIPLDKVQQECCMSYEGKKLFLGDTVMSEPVCLRGGRICISTDAGQLDLATGGMLDGYIAKDTG